MNNTLTLYGANGYTAKLILPELLKRNIKPILAGRNRNEIQKLAEDNSLEYRIFDLEDVERIKENLKNVHTLLNCAGPFMYTAKELMEACLSNGTNYLDITGEIPVIAMAFSFNEKAKQSGVVILPSVGFDIIPTDCLAKRLYEKLPDAVDLKLVLINKKGKLSRGTLKTTLEFIQKGAGKILREGKVIDSPFGEYKLCVKHDGLSFNALSIPWGDIYASYKSTGIPNATVYFSVPKILLIIKPLLIKVMKILKYNFIKKLVVGFIANNIEGPSLSQRNNTTTIIWGKVENGKGKFIEEAFEFMEGYNMTAVGAAECAVRILNNDVQPGTYTPSLAFGSSFMEKFIVKKIL